jgi:hypothetical protein
MNFLSRLAGALITVTAVAANAQTAGKNLAMDFRTTVSIQGVSDSSVMTGRAVGTADRMRLDVKGTTPHVVPLASDSVSMIVTDSGKTITYLDTREKQYIRVQPAEMIAKAQQMGQIKMEFSDTDAKVDDLGAGPTILGHPTTHYRVVTGMTMKVNAMGQEQTVKLSSSTDSYFATDINGVLNPFATLSGGDMANMFGTGSPEFAKKLKAARSKLPNRTPLRASSSATIVAHGETRVTTTKAEVTSIQWVNADPKLFDLPAGYTAAPMPGMAGTSGEPRK